MKSCPIVLVNKIYLARGSIVSSDCSVYLGLVSRAVGSDILSVRSWDECMVIHKSIVIRKWTTNGISSMMMNSGSA